MNRSLRYLRIAFSASCLIVAVLLIALRARSYKSFTDIQAVVFHTHIEVGSVRGCTTFHCAHRKLTWSPPTLNQMDDSYLDGHDFEGAKVTNRFGLGIERNPLIVYVPHWFLIALTAALAAIPWIPLSKRFSLRTLLFATTLIAVVLGAAAYFQ